MGLFGKRNKKIRKDNDRTDEILQQDLTLENGNPGRVFIIHLLMEDKCRMPDKDYMLEIMNKHLGNINCFKYDEDVTSFEAKSHIIEFKDGNAPALLMVMGCSKIDSPLLDTIGLSQLWDCPSGTEMFFPIFTTPVIQSNQEM